MRCEVSTEDLLLQKYQGFFLTRYTRNCAKILGELSQLRRAPSNLAMRPAVMHGVLRREQ